MATIKIRYLVIKPGRGGTTRYFWQPNAALRRAGWFPRRLAEDTGRDGDAIREAEELNAAVDAWRKGEINEAIPAAPRGSIDNLIIKYRASDDFKTLADKTRRGYNQNLDVLSAWAGDKPVNAISALDVKTLYKAFKKRTPSKAAAVVVMLRILYGYALSENLATINPAKLVPIKRGRQAKTEDDIWPQEAINAFVKAADLMNLQSVGTAVMLNEWIGQREGDLLTLPADAYRDGTIQFTQSKTGARVFLPVDLVPKLVDRLKEERMRQVKATVTATTLLVCELTGKAWSEDLFRKKVAQIRTKAAEECEACRHLQFMRLRHTAVTRLAEAGVDTKDIASITGHSLQTVEQIFEHYLVRTKKMATNAFTKRLAAEAKDFEK